MLDGSFWGVVSNRMCIFRGKSVCVVILFVSVLVCVLFLVR